MAQGDARIPADTDALLHHPDVVRVSRAIAYAFGFRTEHDIEDFVGDVEERALKVTKPRKRPTEVSGWKALVREVGKYVGREKLKALSRRGKSIVGPTDGADDHVSAPTELDLDALERAAIRAIVEEVLREQAGGKHTAVMVAGFMTGAPPREMAKDAGISPAAMRNSTSKLREVLQNKFVRAGLALAGLSLFVWGGVEGFHQYQVAQDAQSFDANSALPRRERTIDEPPRARDLPDTDKAAQLHDKAVDACGRKDWSHCADYLDMARMYDPSITQLPDVQAMQKLLNTYNSAKPR